MRKTITTYHRSALVKAKYLDRLAQELIYNGSTFEVRPIYASQLVEVTVKVGVAGDNFIKHEPDIPRSINWVWSTVSRRFTEV